MKLPVHGGAGARSPRQQGEYAQPFSRAQIAKPTYTNPTPNDHAAALSGDPQNPQQPAGGGANAGSGTDTTATPAVPPGMGPYNLSADPVLQQVQASVARADADAGASALRSREQDLLQYGDSGLASSVLGANDPMVQAAGQNQESTLALLKRGYEQGLSNFDNKLDPSLLFSGARIKDEGLIGQDYQDRKSAAAQQIQAELGQITDAYNNALEGNQSQLDGALADAYARAVQAALTSPPASSGSASGSTGGSKPPKPKPKKKKLAHAAGGGRQVAS